MASGLGRLRLAMQEGLTITASKHAMVRSTNKPHHLPPQPASIINY